MATGPTLSMLWQRKYVRFYLVSRSGKIDCAELVLIGTASNS